MTQEKSANTSLIKEDVIKEAENRAEVYAIISRFLYRPDEALVRGLSDGTLLKTLETALTNLGYDLESYRQGMDAIRAYAADVKDKTPGEVLIDLDVEHTRLFVGPSKLICPPYESVWTEPVYGEERGMVMGDCTVQVKKAYQAAGLEVSDSLHDLPDFMAVELEFMRYLASVEKNAFLVSDESENPTEFSDEMRAELVSVTREREIAFFKEHIMEWIPTKLCPCIEENAKKSFYVGAASIVRLFTDADYVELKNK